MPRGISFTVPSLLNVMTTHTSTGVLRMEFYFVPTTEVSENIINCPYPPSGKTPVLVKLERVGPDVTSHRLRQGYRQERNSLEQETLDVSPTIEYRIPHRGPTQTSTPARWSHSFRWTSRIPPLPFRPKLLGSPPPPKMRMTSVPMSPADSSQGQSWELKTCH